ncbi:hypothetical protein U0C82_01090 [Fulvimarina sp. 2208YS6-2-32]|uniref:Flagellar FliJ protein n=1 Tax=Fulvimarina uroteuthidis TaxID=3098149 RepID=A0ABU5HXY9_9HYPH|nr:hypothetical protein [Fulvimarina sp. 2208YS6-2-32]MDY8107742.1 hypothetical protein [Fulvimarina sp. 2208YS6-2-32]
MNDAKSRKKRLERILKVQGQKRQIEEWALTQLKRKRAEIDRSDSEILQSLAPSSELHGLFIGAKVNSLRRNDAARRENEAERAKGEVRLAEARRQEKGVERRLTQAGKDAAAQDEAIALDGHVESFLARLSNSLG